MAEAARHPSSNVAGWAASPDIKQNSVTQINSRLTGTRNQRQVREEFILLIS